MAIDMRFTLKDARQCAENHIEAGTTCFGCSFYSLCGIGDYDAAKLAEFIGKVDPSGLDITLIPLRPIGAENVNTRK